MAERRAIVFAWQAWLAAGKSVTAARHALEQLTKARYAEIQTGLVVVSTSENGGSVSFAIPQDLGPAQVVEFTHQAIQWIDDVIPAAAWEVSATAETYFFPKRITRLRPRFSVTEGF